MTTKLTPNAWRIWYDSQPDDIRRKCDACIKVLLDEDYTFKEAATIAYESINLMYGWISSTPGTIH